MFLKRLCIWMTGAFLSVSLTGSAQSTVEYTTLTQSRGAPECWGTRPMQCEDGQAPMALHSLVYGEQATGVIESDLFDAPGSLSFWVAGASHQKANAVQLVDAATGEVLRNEAPPESDTGHSRSWDLTDLKGRKVKLRLVDGDTGTGWAWLAVGRLDPPVAAMPQADVKGLPAGWTFITPPPDKVEVGGVPFLKQSYWGAEGEGETFEMETPGLQGGGRLYLLGALNSLDLSCPGWGGGDSFQNFFIGDRIGTLVLNYASGQCDAVPLIYGYTVWWSEPYKRGHVPLSVEGPERDLLRRALHVANGMDGYKGDALPYFIALKLRPEPLASISIADRATKKGHFVLKGITVDGRQVLSADGAAPEILTSTDPTPEWTRWLEQYTIDPANAFPVEVKEALDKLARCFYTFPEDVTEEAIAKVTPEVTADNFAGPKVRFAGPPEATLMTHIWYENANNMISRVDPDGMVHESDKGSTNFPEFGPWIPGLGPFHDSFYTRIRALMLMSEMGFTDKVESAIDFSDKWQLYYPKAFPEIQLGGKPVPAHASVICNVPHVYWDLSRGGGWPTKQTSSDMGNAETDGHGLLMLTKWRQWIQLGRPAEWVERHWEAINATAEFIPWQLDNPELSFSQHGLLYSESEGGMVMESLYANTACYFGLLGFIEMAKAAGHEQEAQRWRGISETLLANMNAWFPKQDPTWGDVWDPAKSAGWGYEQGVLAPFLFGADFYGWDAVRKLPEGWLERTRRSYDMIVQKNMKPAYCAPAGLGYGQNYCVQSALLLDRMDEATQMIHWLARFCYAPRLEHPFRSPEGITMATDGSVWRRWGDLGNLYQMAEAVYSIQAMLGVDDIDPAELKLMPRIPNGWTEMEIKDWPVRMGDQTAMLTYQLTRDPAGKQRMNVETSVPVPAMAVRLGPFPKDAMVKVTANGKPMDSAPDQGAVYDPEFQWVWVRLAGDDTCRFDIEAAL